MIYRPDEILDLLDNANCCEDVQHIVSTIHDYPEMFPPNFYQERKSLLLIYANLFI
jgi:hypothetical protein